MDDRAFRNAMGKFATGVTVITTMWENDVHGMTANAFMSVSLQPRLITVSVAAKARMHDKMQRAKKFAVSILTEDQVEMSMHFAGQKEKHDVSFAWVDGVPIIKDALANIICNVYDTHQAGDHTLYIGEVIDLHVREGTPLIFFEGKYGKGLMNAYKAV